MLYYLAMRCDAIRVVTMTLAVFSLLGMFASLVLCLESRCDDGIMWRRMKRIVYWGLGLFVVLFMLWGFTPSTRDALELMGRERPSPIEIQGKMTGEQK